MPRETQLRHASYEMRFGRGNVACALSAVSGCQAQELRRHAGNVANSHPTAQTANVMAPRHLNSIRLEKKSEPIDISHSW